MPEENSRAAALISGRILPKVIRDRFGQKANAQRAHGPVFCGRRDANMRPAKMSKAEIHLPSLANRPRFLHDFEGSTAADEHQISIQRQRAVKKSATNRLIDRVVAADVLANDFRSSV